MQYLIIIACLLIVAYGLYVILITWQGLSKIKLLAKKFKAMWRK